MTLYVADIASYQHGLIPAQLKPDIAALIVKCTQGTTYVDPDYAAWLDEARATGLLVGAYHYVDGSNPTAQAAWLKARMIDPTLIVMLDFEQGGLAQALDVADAMDAAGLHVRLIYLSRSYWSALGSPDLATPFNSRNIRLVNASYPNGRTGTPVQLYPGDGAAGWNMYGGVAPTLYQFTDSATEAGQRVDCSAFRGTLAQLTDLFTVAAPLPSSAPTSSTIVLEEDPVQIEPLSVHPGDYAVAFAPDKTELVFVADGDNGAPAVLRVAVWVGDSVSVVPALKVGGNAGHSIGHTLPKGCTGVTIKRQDSGPFAVGVAFQ